MNTQLRSGYSRNSFDRFGDDLCEEILQYLSFKDKIRFECVNKQFKRSVLKRQFVLDIDLNPFNSNRLPPIVLTYLNVNTDKGLKCLPIIEHVLKKCAQINSITILLNQFSIGRTITYEHLISIIADNCRALKAFKYYEWVHNLSEHMWQYLGEKCGKTLKSIYIDSRGVQYKSLLGYCANVDVISGISLTQLISDQLLVPKLCKVRALKDCDRTDLMDIFVSRYKNTVKVFHASFMGIHWQQFFTQLSQLFNLEKLSLIMFGIDLTQFAFYLRKVLVNCTKLKYLTISINNCTQTINYTQLLNSISANYPHLKHVDIYIPYENITQFKYNHKNSQNFYV